jgi:DNA-binding transcriptional MerR regulator
MDVTIGELSRQTGVKVPTIRYYEQVGLLAAPLRTEGKQRRYGAPDELSPNFGDGRAGQAAAVLG